MQFRSVLPQQITAFRFTLCDRFVYIAQTKACTVKPVAERTKAHFVLRAAGLYLGPCTVATWQFTPLYFKNENNVYHHYLAGLNRISETMV